MGCKRLSDSEEQRLVEEYKAGESVNILQKKYGFATKKSITDKVKKYYPDTYKEIMKEAKENRKQYELNFEKINSNFIAYFIGLMLTDGYIVDKNQYGIDLTDEDCIAFISEITGKQYHSYNYYSDKNRKTRHRITFNGAEQVKNLQRYGIVERKSYTLPALQLEHEEEKYLPYLIRGIIDGDGCIFKTSQNTVGFYICSMSKEFIESLKNIFEEKFFMDDMKITCSDLGLWHVQSFLQTNIFKLMAIVYNKPYGMARKYNKLREMFRDYNKNNQQEFIWNVG